MTVTLGGAHNVTMETALTAQPGTMEMSNYAQCGRCGWSAAGLSHRFVAAGMGKLLFEWILLR